MGDNRIVFAARPYCDEDDDRHIVARIAAMLVNNPSGSVLEQHLAAAGIPATRRYPRSIPSGNATSW